MKVRDEEAPVNGERDGDGTSPDLPAWDPTLRAPLGQSLMGGQGFSLGLTEATLPSGSGCQSPACSGGCLQVLPAAHCLAGPN